jgi:mono/diheme cytochrome c family protein
MNRRLFLGMFEREEDLLGATEEARLSGLRIVDVYTPYAVHGLDRAMGLGPSRLGRACLVFGLLGAGLAFWFQNWASAVDWPINVGGRPWNSWPAFIPVVFELMVLFAGLGVVLAFFAVSRLYPGRRAVLPTPTVTDGRFALVLEESDAAFDVRDVRRLFAEHHAVATEEREDQDPRPETEPAPRSRRRWNVALLVVLLIMVVLNWLLGADPGRPNLEFLPGMAHTPRYNAFSANPNFHDGQTLQLPPAGTIPHGQPPGRTQLIAQLMAAQGLASAGGASPVIHRAAAPLGVAALGASALVQLPLHYQASPEDALRAGKELHNPLNAASARWRERGAFIFTNYCAVCHGPGGKGDGPVTLRGVPPPPSLLAEHAQQMKEGQLFHVLTYGQNNMASYASQLSRVDRWSVILHVRALQQQAGKGQP